MVLSWLVTQPSTDEEIEVLDRTGTVDGITIRETRLTTFDGELVIIPNRDVYKNVILVTTHGPRLRQHFTVGIAYENDPVEARAALQDSGEITPDGNLRQSAGS